MLAVIFVAALLAVQGEMALASGSHASYCVHVEEPSSWEYATFASFLAPENGNVRIQGPPAYHVFHMRINYCTSCSNNVNVEILEPVRRRVYRGYYTTYRYVPQNGSSPISRSHTSVSITATRRTRKFTIETPGKVPLSRNYRNDSRYYSPFTCCASFSDQSSTPTFELYTYSIGRVIKNFEVTRIIYIYGTAPNTNNTMTIDLIQGRPEERERLPVSLKLKAYFKNDSDQSPFIFLTSDIEGVLVGDTELRNPFQPGQAFTVILFTQNHQFAIAVNGNHFAAYRFHVPVKRAPGPATVWVSGVTTLKRIKAY